MELWIRSQDGEQLVNVRGVVIEKKTKSKYFNIFGSGYFLGTYKTKERALEVLDEIQRLLTDLQYMSYAIASSSFCGYRPNVYEMPKE